MGYETLMTDPRMGDHATGLELQIEELIVRRETARREGWMDEVYDYEVQITALQLELTEMAERATDNGYRRLVIRGAETARDLAAHSKTA